MRASRCPEAKGPRVSKKGNHGRVTATAVLLHIIHGLAIEEAHQLSEFDRIATEDCPQ